MINLDTLPLADMQVFAHVVQRRGFAAAARQMGITTSAVSRSVGRLERQLGVKLLHRTTRALSLTEIGSEVYEGCLQMLQGAEQALARATAYREQPQGVLRISAPVMFGDLWLAPHLPRFGRQWPEVHVQLSMSDAMVDIVAEGIDLAIRITGPQALPPTLVARPLRQFRYLLVANPAYLAQHAPIETPADLQLHRCLTLGYGAFQNIVDLVAAKGPMPASVERIGLHTPITIASSIGLMQALVSDADTGVGLVADLVAEPAIAEGRLTQVLPQWELAGSYAPRTVYAVYAPGPHMPPKLRAVLDFLQTIC